MNATVKPPADAPLPFDIEAEQSLLGAILINNDAYERVASFLEPRHFGEPLHGNIFDACGRLIRTNRLASPVTLRPHFSHDAAMAEVGGTDYLAEICKFTPTVINAADFGRMIFDLAMRRELIKTGNEIVATAVDPPIDMTAQQQIEEAERALYKIAGTSQISHGRLEAVAAVAARAVRDAEAAYKNPDGVGMSSGIPSIDDVAGKLQVSDLFVLAGATSSGKTSAGQQWTYNVAQRGEGVAVFSLEMTAEQYIGRFIAQIADVSSDKIESGRMTASEIERVVAAEKDFDGLPLFIDGSETPTVAQIRSRVRRLQRQRSIKLVLVDHLRFVTAADPRAKEMDQIQQVTRELKAMAKELGVCVVLLVQMNRETRQRKNKRPILSDLYGSSAIEQNADVVAFVHREIYWLRQEQPDQSDELAYGKWIGAMQAAEGKAEIIVAKRRRGKIGTAHLRFNERLTRFEEIN